MSSDQIFNILIQYVYVIPYLLVYVVGLILAITRKRHHPRSAGFAFLGFLILLFQTLFFATLRIFLIFERDATDLPVASYARMMSIIGLAQSLCFTLGICLLIFAIFVGRMSPPSVRQRSAPDPLDAPPRPEVALPADAAETTHREKRDL
jgi:hypothetical protein